MDFKEFAKKNNLITEVKFNKRKLNKVVSLYAKIMGKQMGGEFKVIGLEEYSRKTGNGKGYRAINQNGEMIRFNWDERKSKKAQYELTSMDYWAKGNTDFTKPTRTVMFGPELNVLKVLAKIVDALKVGTINEAKEIINEANLILEALPHIDLRGKWLKDRGLAVSARESSNEMRKQVRKKAPELMEELEIFLGQKEKNTFEDGLQKLEKQMNDTKLYADPDLVFNDIEDLTGLVASGKWRTLIVCGMGGVGKTYHITKKLEETLGKKGVDWMYHSGASASPSSFYKTLFMERDSLIVFDEADSFLKNDEIVMMLKPILDTSGDNMAEYLKNTQNTTGYSQEELEALAQEVAAEIADGKIVGQRGNKGVLLPSRFIFKGQMIFISNMPSEKIDQAIMSRSIFVDVHLAEQDVLKRIQTILRLGIKEDATAAESYTEEDIALVMDALGGGDTGGGSEEIKYMTPEYAKAHKQITVRAGKLGLILLKSGIPNWARLASLYA